MIHTHQSKPTILTSAPLKLTHITVTKFWLALLLNSSSVIRCLLPRTFWISFFKFQILQQSYIKGTHYFPKQRTISPLHLSICDLGTILFSSQPPVPSLLVWLPCSFYLFNWASQLILSLLLSYHRLSFLPLKTSPLSYLIILLPIFPPSSNPSHKKEKLFSNILFYSFQNMSSLRGNLKFSVALYKYFCDN